MARHTLFLGVVFLVISCIPSSDALDPIEVLFDPKDGLVSQLERNLLILDELKELLWSFGAYVRYHGFDFKEYTVATEDEVLITLFRITQPKVFSERDSTPVLLSHGFAASSFDYFANARNESLAFILADNGYDVWAINYRGHYLSSRTIRSSYPGPKFYFRATWQHMAKYDLPAVIDFIQQKTNGKPFHIVGQSMGTSAVFAYLSTHHKYDDKILMFHALTPVSSLGNDTSDSMKSLFAVNVKLPKMLKHDLEYVLAYGAPILNSRIAFSAPIFKNYLCLLSTTYCENLLGLLFDREQNMNNPHIRTERFPIYFSEYPAGATMANIFLFGSQFNRVNWTMTDYDVLKLPGMSNQQEYGQSSPPEYDFNSIGVKMSLHYSSNDVVTGVETAKAFGERMKDHLIPGGMHIIEGNKFSHQDSLWAWDARCYIYNQVLKDMEGFEEKRRRVRNQQDSYRKRIRDFVSSLPYEDGCVGLPP